MKHIRILIWIWIYHKAYKLHEKANDKIWKLKAERSLKDFGEE